MEMNIYVPGNANLFLIQIVFLAPPHIIPNKNNTKLIRLSIGCGHLSSEEDKKKKSELYDW